jgi:hypothetical protein
MIAMKYGAMPVVCSVGGLKDSVCDFEGEFSPSMGRGLTMQDASVQTSIHATNRALYLCNDKPRFDEMIRHNMSVDFSWDEKSKEYLSLFLDLKDGWLPERAIKKYEIPSYYNINTLKALPVDSNSLYSYWEITTALLDGHQLSINQLQLKAFVDEVEVATTAIYDRVGSHYFYPEMDFKPVCTKIGFIREDGLFIPLLESNTFIAPNAKVIKNDNIIWRSITSDAFSKKAHFLSETYYEVSDSLNSTSILKRRQLQELTDKNQRAISSTIVTKKEEA